jgi:hypothetical protein
VSDSLRGAIMTRVPIQLRECFVFGERRSTISARHLASGVCPLHFPRRVKVTVEMLCRIKRRRVLRDL